MNHSHFIVSPFSSHILQHSPRPDGFWRSPRLLNPSEQPAPVLGQATEILCRCSDIFLFPQSICASLEAPWQTLKCSHIYLSSTSLTGRNLFRTYLFVFPLLLTIPESVRHFSTSPALTSEKPTSARRPPSHVSCTLVSVIIMQKIVRSEPLEYRGCPWQICRMRPLQALSLVCGTCQDIACYSRAVLQHLGFTLQSDTCSSSVCKHRPVNMNKMSPESWEQCISELWRVSNRAWGICKAMTVVFVLLPAQQLIYHLFYESPHISAFVSQPGSPAVS